MTRRILEIAQALALCTITVAVVVCIDFNRSAMGDEPASVTDLKVASPAELKIRAAISRPTAIDFIDTPLSDAMQFLGDSHNISIIIDTKALSEAGIGTNEPINLKLKGVALQSALKIMLKPLGLTTIVADEVLKVTTVQVANSVMSTHVYDVRALRKHDIESTSLAELIPRVVSPSSWSDKQGSIQALPGCVVIHNNAQVHADVNELFRQLMRLSEQNTSRQSTFIRPTQALPNDTAAKSAPEPIDAKPAAP